MFIYIFQFRPKTSPRAERPFSEPNVQPGDDHDHMNEKEKKHRSMFGFLKKKKDKDHTEDHKEHKKDKKHKDKKADVSLQFSLLSGVFQSATG